MFRRLTTNGLWRNIASHSSQSSGFQPQLTPNTSFRRRFSTEPEQPENKSNNTKYFIFAALAGLIATASIVSYFVPLKEHYYELALLDDEKKLRVSLGKWSALMDQCSIAVYLQSSSYLNSIFGKGYQLHFKPLNAYLKDLVIPSFLGGASKDKSNKYIAPDQYDYCTQVVVEGNGKWGILRIYRQINEKILLELGGESTSEKTASYLESLLEGYMPGVMLFPTSQITHADRMKIHKSMEDDFPGKLLPVRFAYLEYNDGNEEVHVVLADNRECTDLSQRLPTGFPSIDLIYFEEPKEIVPKKWFGLW